MPNAKVAETTSRILDAVMQLILTGGLSAVTLSAVCRKAGLSKGGLMHHFPSKDSLVDAFLQRAVHDYLALVDQATDRLERGSGKRAGAIVDLFLGDQAAFEPGANCECAAVMVALIQGGEGKSQVREFYATIFALMRDDGISRDLAELIVATLDGVWLQSMIEANATIVPRAKRIRRQLKRMIDREVSSKSKPVLCETQRI